ncbi:MAG: hypothetical protein HQL68_09860 [Magnetococcales bacterium]|nr:hypothetical protein [Magnetococcales bacterium]
MSGISDRSLGFRNLSQILLNKKFWIWQFLIVAGISVCGLIYFGVATYTGAPPLVDFKSSRGETIIPHQQITRGEEIFHLRGLMSYGSFWGDGAERGPDFTADALHRIVVSMGDFYKNRLKERAQIQKVPQYDADAISLQVKRELHSNLWNKEEGNIRINDAQIYALQKLNVHYSIMFTDPDYPELFQTGYITDLEDIKALTAFSTGEPGWLLPTDLERIIAIHITGPMIRQQAIHRLRQPISGVSYRFFSCLWGLG